VAVQACTFIVAFLKEEWDSIRFMMKLNGRFNASSDHAASKVSHNPSVEVGRNASTSSYPPLLLGALAGMASLAATIAGWTGADVPGILLAVVGAIATLIVTILMYQGGDR
jgi:uncharacterized membrane protein